MEPINAVERLIAVYRLLPGIGNKTAERLAYATLGFTQDDLKAFIAALQNVMENVHTCPKCGMPIDTPVCPLCDDPKRDGSVLLVVNDPKNVISFERTGKYQGRYFVLSGLISPIKGVGPEDIRIPELRKLIVEEKVSEVILACSSTVEGELTARYINGYLSDLKNLKITHLAYGLPVGAELEYVDKLTIERSLKARVSMKEDQ